MKILGIIPARGVSKGVPRKNIKLLGTKPLLQYTSDIALKSTFLQKVVLSSEDDKILAYAKNLGIEVPFKRPIELSSDSASSLSVVQHAINFFEEKNEFFDAICLLQVTYPFRTLELLDKAIKKFIIANTDSLVSVQKVPHEYNPHWTFKEDEKGNLKIATGDANIISRRQELPNAYHRDGSIYLTKVDVIKQKKSFYGDSMAYIESPKDYYVNIDTIKDWKHAEEMLKSYKN